MLRPLRIAALLPATLALWFLCQLPSVRNGRTLRCAFDWLPAMDIRISFYLDGLSLLFCLVITSVGAFVFLYAGAYLKKHVQAVRFLVYLIVFTLSMLGVVLSDNLVVLFVFWELTSLSSYLLIGFDHASEPARRAARMALLVTGAGGLALLAGIVMLGSAAGSYEITRIVAQAATVQDHRWAPIILALLLLGAFTKSAQFPFHFWLPHAMSAPTPVSAFLHSATMVKAGVYLMARLHPVFAEMPLWTMALTSVGAATAVLGSIAALMESDLKRVLAYSTVMGLGLLTLFLGSERSPALAAALTFLLVHALYKSALFMVSGNIDHGTGTRQLDRLGGLFRHMPLTAAAAAAAGLSMAGFPLFFGFIGKEIIYKGALLHESGAFWVVLIAVAGNSCMTAVAGLAALRPFLGRAGRTPRTPHEAPLEMWAGPLVLGGLCLLFGVIPGWVAKWLVEPALRALHPAAEPVHLTLFHGFSPPLLLSIITLAAGVALYRRVCDLWRPLKALESAVPLKPVWLYEGALAGVARTAALLTRCLQHGSLQRYTAAVVLTFVTAVGATFVFQGLPLLPLEWPSASIVQWSFILLVAAGAMAVVLTRRRMTAVCSLGVCGAGCAVIFLMFGAPDLALTQLLVETLTVIIVSIVLLRLPDLRAVVPRPGIGRALRLLLAGGAGALSTVLLQAAVRNPLDRSVTAFFEQNSLSAAHGRNIVNVILSDFRALDTLGEITVVAVAGFAVYTLIKGACEFHMPHGSQRTAGFVSDVPDARASLILKTATRLLAGLIGVFSVYLLLRGHNAPGGGFAGALTAATAFALLTIAEGADALRQAVPIDPRSIAMGGLALSLAAGLAGAGFEKPFFGAVWWAETHGKTTVGSPFFFDLGVYLSVLGAILTLMLTLEEEIR